MDEQSLKFFKMATASALGILILMLITAIITAVYTTSSTDTYQVPSATSTYTITPTQWTPLDSARYQKQEEEQYKTDNLNVPPCTDPCQVRVEYSNQYFMPYPTYRYKDRFYYGDYPVYPHYAYQHYPNNQRFFHHRVIESNSGY